MIATSVSVLQNQPVDADVGTELFEKFDQLDLERDIYIAAEAGL